MKFKYLIAFLIVMSLGVAIAYSTYGAPSEFGNDTTTTCYIGGDFGVVNCIGNITGAYLFGDGSELTGLAGGGDINAVNTPDSYLYGGAESGTVNLYINETYLNGSIDARATGLGDNSSWNESLARDLFLENGTNIQLGVNNITTTGYGFFGWIGSLVSKVTKIWVTDVNATNITASNYMNATGSIEWIKPEHIYDVDAADIEGDLNTFVDIAGDNMTGNLNNTGNITTNYFFGYLNWSWIKNIPSYTLTTDLVSLVGNWSADKGDYSTTAEANVLYRAESWDNITGIPHATPSDGDITHLSTADQIYDFVIAFSYATQSWVTTQLESYVAIADLVSYVGNWSADKDDYSTTAEADGLYAGIEWDYNQTTPAITAANSYTDTGLAGQDACSEITGCVEGAYSSEGDLTTLLDDNYEPISAHFDASTTTNITCLNTACTWYTNATNSCMYWPSGGKDCGAA